MPVADFLRPVVNWFAHHISRGLDWLGVLSAAQLRWPELPVGSLEEAGQVATHAVDLASRVNTLAPDEPLSNLNPNLSWIDDEVEIRNLVTLQDAAGMIDDMNIRVSVPWSATLADVIERIGAALRSRLADSPGLLVISTDIIPPFLMGPPNPGA